jgi:hypothetical protein
MPSNDAKSASSAQGSETGSSGALTNKEQVTMTTFEAFRLGVEFALVLVAVLLDSEGPPDGDEPRPQREQ